MKDITLELIKNILAVDETVTKGKADDILFACTQEQSTSSRPRHLINAKEAMRILDVSRPTLTSYVKKRCYYPNCLVFPEDSILEPRRLME